jgi:ATP synthase protein I
MRFSGIAFEMLATIGVGTYGGYLLDEYLELSFPVFLVSLSMLSLLVSLYLLYKRLPKE